MRDVTLTFFTPAELLPIPTPVDDLLDDVRDKIVLIKVDGIYTVALFTDYGDGNLYFDAGADLEWAPDEVIEWAYLPKGADGG